MPEPESALQTMKIALRNTCPQCGKAKIFEKALSFSPRETCPECGFALGKHDNGDGPAVFLIFILGTLLVPLALWADHAFSIPLWVHGVLWTFIALILCLLSLKPIKSYIMHLQYKHLPKTFTKEQEPEN